MLISKQKSRCINQIKTCDGTGLFEVFTYAALVIHWPNFEASHSFTTLVQRNHHLVAVLYLKVSFELRSCYSTHTDNHSPATHYPPGTAGCCSNLFLSRFPWELAILPCRLQDFPLWFETQTQALCLNHRVFGIYTVSKTYLFKPVKICW